MIKDITEYVRICSNYQRVQMHYYKSYDNLIAISLKNVKLFHTVIMNFIINMFSAKNSYTKKISDAILILINKLIKHVIYITIIKNLNTENLINIL